MRKRAEQPDYRMLDAASLRGLAHPVRMQILERLRMEGPSTSSLLAESLGVRTGTTSWHLKKLAEHGFIEEIEARGTRRERWWRTARRDWAIDAGSFLSDPELADSTTTLLDESIRQSFARASRFLHQSWSKRWRQAWILQNTTLVMDANALAAMRAELTAVVERYRGMSTEASSARHVVLQIQGFPTKPEKGDHYGSDR